MKSVKWEHNGEVVTVSPSSNFIHQLTYEISTKFVRLHSKAVNAKYDLARTDPLQAGVAQSV
jgi:hypothetical protein